MKNQDILRNEFHEQTLLVISHELENISSYDKVLVMDNGKCIGFDKPQRICLDKNEFIFKSASKITDNMDKIDKKLKVNAEANGNS